MADFRELLERKEPGPDLYLDLPGGLASWVDKKGRKNIQISTGKNAYWEFTLKTGLEAEDIKILALQGMESVSVKSGKLFIEVRK